MVMIEAMAKGTPVVALRRGAVPGGHPARPHRLHLRRRDRAAGGAARSRLAWIRPTASRTCRTAFSVDLMAQRYERVYRSLIGGQQQHTAPLKALHTDLI